MFNSMLMIIIGLLIIIRYMIKTSISRSSREFIKLIKKKNNDIFIGNINEYKKQKEKIEYIKQIKERTRI